jgi:major vault protein
VKVTDSSSYIPDVYEEVVEMSEVITLSARQYCVILDPVSGPKW